jgi:hypothetical protein
MISYLQLKRTGQWPVLHMTAIRCICECADFFSRCRDARQEIWFFSPSRRLCGEKFRSDLTQNTCAVAKSTALTAWYLDCEYLVAEVTGQERS